MFETVMPLYLHHEHNEMLTTLWLTLLGLEVDATWPCVSGGGVKLATWLYLWH